MPPPFEYQNASMLFERFLVNARDNADLATTNMAWNMVEGVLRTFRKRLTVQQVAAFSNVLPPLVRALFLEDWDPEIAPIQFVDRDALLREVRQLRHQHNFSPDNAISAVAAALWQNVDELKLQRVLEKFSDQAQDYWNVESVCKR